MQQIARLALHLKLAEFIGFGGRHQLTVVCPQNENCARHWLVRYFLVEDLADHRDSAKLRSSIKTEVDSQSFSLVDKLPGNGCSTGKVMLMLLAPDELVIETCSMVVDRAR